MNNIQLPQLEISFLLEKSLPFLRAKKFQYSILYILIVFYLSLPSFQIPLLEYSHFRITSLMQQRAIEHNFVYYPRQSWTDISDVNPDLLKGIISMEDGRFFIHRGIDWKELKTSLKLNRRKGRVVRGGSTITMQLAKNLYLTTKKSIFRKAKEFLITMRMEKELSKRAILQNYVNAVEWGDGIFGIREASEIYFGKEPAQLTRMECARLAAVIPSPLRHSPAKNSVYVSRRSSIILGRMNDVELFPGH